MEKIKPEKALEMLQKKGVDISLEQAAQVLELLRKLVISWFHNIWNVKEGDKVKHSVTFTKFLL